MKKLIACVLSLAAFGAANANVVIFLHNTKNDDVPFIASLKDGQKVYAANVGSMAVIPDGKLSKYADKTPFAVGLRSPHGITLKFCQAAGSTTQFVFKYNASVTTGNAIDMTRKGNTITCTVRR